jgi:acetyltransferase-like isoleucine patch superfamily enzyme
LRLLDLNDVNNADGLNRKTTSERGSEPLYELADEWVEIGSNVQVQDGVVLGEHVSIGNNVTIYEGAIIGSYVVIQDNAVIGKQPFKAKNSVLLDRPKQPPVEIGRGCTIGTSSIVYAGAKLGEDVFVADLATIRERVVVGDKTIVGRGVSIENDCTVGSKCKLETNCYITAYSSLGNEVFVAPGVITSNDNYLGRTRERFAKMKGITMRDGARIGANATTLPGITIEADGVVAAGSVVTKDVAVEELVVGIPARFLRKVPKSQLLKYQ